MIKEDIETIKQAFTILSDEINTISDSILRFSKKIESVLSYLDDCENKINEAEGNETSN